ncbi:glutamine--fructose-6-phosphate transaminase (isomerizing) [bacterium]|nr:glutamine--fructose-6-phosphate transaminase (isomerizing) [bacterium]
MCGIVGYIGPRDATPIILNGLKRLEYRGYDSAGLAVLENGHIEVRRDAGKLNRLVSIVEGAPLSGNLGIGHTRWATHGEPNVRNAHPHIGTTGQVVVVHNGIVENFLELRDELTAEGVELKSETDSEIIVHLIEKFLSTEDDLLSASRKAFSLLKGHHGIVVISSNEPDKIIASRIGNAGGVVFGFGEGEMFVASDLPAILEHTRKVSFLETHQIAVVSRDGVEVQTFEGEPVESKIDTIAWDPVAAEKGEYRHFMQKEIHEQVRSITDTISGRVDFEKAKIILPQLNLTEEFARKIEKIVLIACGTAYYAAMIGKVLIERIARIPVEVDVASEFRYSDPIINDRTVVIAISQSGETADTLAAMAEGKKRGATLWSIVNAIGSQAMRVADGYISMQTGPEIGVASTKAYTAPLVDQYMLAILLADLRGTISAEERRKYIEDLRHLPELVGQVLAREKQYEQVALSMKDAESCIYLGRGINMPTAYEGALKLKEISYIHAEGYPGGEMKHGPIALFDKSLPVVVIATKDPWYDKMISQIEQTKTRGAPVIAMASDGDKLIPPLADHVLWIPEIPWLLSPVIAVIPLQILAYHIAAIRGLDVDQPRNLAKSVTVE